MDRSDHHEAAWLLLAILLWLNNGLRYIYEKSEV